MGDRMFASEGDSVNVGRQETSPWEDRWTAGHPAALPGTEDSTGVVRRLQERVDRHLWLLGRMQDDPLQPEPAGLPELMDIAGRMRRDTESLLLLAGEDPCVRSVGARLLGDVLAEATAAAEEPRRVDVRTAPAATLTPVAATELLHVLVELIEHVTAVYPGARVDLSSDVEAPGGIVVEVRADGATRHDPDGFGGRRALGAAQRLAQRSRSGIVLRLPSTGPGSSPLGPVATVHCPVTVVTLEEPQRAPLSWPADRYPAVSPLEPAPSEPAPPEPSPFAFEPAALPVRGHGAGNGSAAGHRNGVRAGDGSHGGRNVGGTNGNGPHGRDHGAPAPAAAGRDEPQLSGPAFAPSASSQVDELFGPLLDLAHDPMDEIVATPIFEAIASAWFREDQQERGAGGGADVLTPTRPSGPADGGAPRDWETPSDREWRAAAERAARPEPLPPTSGGLPRRRPGDQLVPPPRRDLAPEQGATERVPDRVRERLSTYQRGLRQGRHRADAQQADPQQAESPLAESPLADPDRGDPGLGNTAAW